MRMIQLLLPQVVRSGDQVHGVVSDQLYDLQSNN